MSDITRTENLKREIGVRSLALAIINMVVGSGIFVLPAIVAEGLGASAIVAYIACGVLIFLLALCFAEVGSNTNKSGGIYTYIEDAFGPWAGFLACNIYVVGASMAADAAVANALADTMQSFFPALSIDVYRMIFLLMLFGGLTWLNISSVKNGVRFVELAGIGKLIPLVLLVVVAIPHVSAENLKWVIQPVAGNIGAASLLLFFAFLGVEVPLSNGGEIKKPLRTVPRGIFLGVSIILILYTSIQCVVQGTLGDQLGNNKDAPLAAVADIALGKPGMIFIIGITILAIVGSLSGAILSMPRVLFAGARDGLLPKPLAKVHPRFATPYVAIMVYAGIGFIMAVSGGFKQLAIIASASSLLLYLGVVLATIKLRKTKAAGTEKGFRIPGGVAIPLTAAAAIIWLLSNLSRNEIIGVAIFILIFSTIYFVTRLIKKNHDNKA
jgi:basic amino acid/polyamine antiporter, APA family